jgi:hypothetical protein
MTPKRYVREVFIVLLLLFGSISGFGLYSLYTDGKVMVTAKVFNLTLSEDILEFGYPDKSYFFKYTYKGIEYEGYDVSSFYVGAKESKRGHGGVGGRNYRIKTFQGENNDFYRNLNEGGLIKVEIRENNPSSYSVQKGTLYDIYKWHLFLGLISVFTIIFLLGSINPNYITKRFGVELK